MIEVFASTVVIWHLLEGRDPAPHRTRHAFKLISIAFFALAAFLFVTSIRSLILGLHPGESPLGIAYLALTATVMFTLAGIKRRTARAWTAGHWEAEATMTFPRRVPLHRHPHSAGGQHLVRLVVGRRRAPPSESACSQPERVSNRSESPAKVDHQAMPSHSARPSRHQRDR